MFKIAGNVIDFYDDPQFLEDHEAVALMGTVLVPLEKLAEQPDRHFAVKIATAVGTHRRFPVYNKASTLLSGRYFDKIAAKLPDEIRKTAGFFLKKAHAVFGLTLPPSLRGAFETPPGNLVRLEAEETPQAATGEMMVKMAEQAFIDGSLRMHVLEKVAKAVEIHKVAQGTGEDLDEQSVWDYVPKDAWGPNTERMLRQREIRTDGEPMIKAAFVEILGELKDAGPRQAPFLVFEFDKFAGFDDYGVSGLMDPFFGVWGGFPIEKRAVGPTEALLDYKLGTVARNQSILDAVFPEKFVRQFTRDPKTTYANSSPAQRKVLDFFMARIPSVSSEADTEPKPGGQKSEIMKEFDAAKRSLEAEQVNPSDRPGQPSPGSSSVQGEIDEGL